MTEDQEQSEPNAEAAFAARTTVADLKKILDGLPEETPVIVRGGEYGYTDASVIGLMTIEWVTDRFGDDLEEPIDVQCLVIE